MVIRSLEIKSRQMDLGVGCTFLSMRIGNVMGQPGMDFSLEGLFSNSKLWF